LPATSITRSSAGTASVHSHHGSIAEGGAWKKRIGNVCINRHTIGAVVGMQTSCARGQADSEPGAGVADNEQA